MGRGSGDGDAGRCDERTPRRSVDPGPTWVTGVLGREALEAIAIVAVTTVALATGRGEERSSLVHGRRRRMPTGLGLVSALAALALGAAAVVVALFGPHHGASPAKAAVTVAGLPGELTGRAPWPANTAQLRARLGLLGLPALSREGTAMHLHQHLDVFVHGRRVPVPAGIGIDAAGGLSLDQPICAGRGVRLGSPGRFPSGLRPLAGPSPGRCAPCRCVGGRATGPPAATASRPGGRAERPAVTNLGGSRLISPLHTHDASGIVHVESPDVRTYTLGQLFGVWGVRLTRRCLGGYCGNGAERVRVYADGRPFGGDPAVLPLAEHAEIVVAFGTPTELPRPVPSGYAFPAGL